MDRDTIYNLGQVCAAIWPFPGDIPLHIQNLIVSRPATLLAEMVKHRDNTAKKDEAVAAIIDKIKDISDPPGGVSLEDQGPFMTGYYHYAYANRKAKELKPKDLEMVGNALYGDRWQTDLARDLKLSDARRIRQWMAKERPIPVGIWADVLGLLRHRQLSLDSVIKSLEATE